VIRSTWRRVFKFLGSAILATWLLVFVGTWSTLASFIPQGVSSNKAVATWALAHPLGERVVRVLGLHQAFAAPVFTVCVLLLGFCTALCAWQRTKVAIHKARMLREAASLDGTAVAAKHDLEVECDASFTDEKVLTVAADTLETLGIKMKRRGDVLGAVSAQWSVWGSPVFHWALLALVLALLTGNLMRSEGLMGIAVGQTKPDAAASYGFVRTGSLHDWGRVKRSIRVDAFDRDFKTGGIDRGPTPTVSVLDAAGKVIKTQRVYPNMTLKTGSLTIYPSDYGLAAKVTLLNTAGGATGSSYQLVDFAGETTAGTAPIETLSVGDSSGNPLLTIAVYIPLDRKGDLGLKQLPKTPTARVVVTGNDGATVLDSVMSPGAHIALPSGDVLRLDGVEYYARLQIVDDMTIPLLYAGLVVALFGLTLAVVARQQIVLATVIEGRQGPVLAMKVRLWRNASSSLSEMKDELAAALSGSEKGSTK